MPVQAQPVAYVNDPRKAGMPATMWQYVDSGRRYIVCPMHTRFDAVSFFVWDNESVNPETGKFAVIRQEATFAAAVAGLAD